MQHRVRRPQFGPADGRQAGVAVCGFFVRDTEPGILVHGMRASIALTVFFSAEGILCYLYLKTHLRADMASPHGEPADRPSGSRRDLPAGSNIF